MKIKTFIGMIIGVALIVVSCDKDPDLAQSEQGSDLSHLKKATQGATQVSGVGVYPSTEECISDGVETPSYAVHMSGDLVGCLYTYIDEFDCSPSGTYREKGREIFVGYYKEEYGTFETTYKFEAKYENCSEDGSVSVEIKGRCQHPVVKGSGTGVFEGVTGRLDFKDDIEAGDFPYKGHLNGLN